MMLFIVLLALVSSAFAQAPKPPYWAWPWEDPVVDGIEFRSMNGTGNNVANPLWGTRDVPYLRHVAPAAYYTGLTDPNNASSPLANGYNSVDPTLPSPRRVSTTLSEAQGAHEVNHLLLNQLQVDWGHFVTADLMETSTNRTNTMTWPIDSTDYWADWNWGSNAPSTQCSLLNRGICGKTGNARFLAIGRVTPFPGTGVPGVPKEGHDEVSQWLDLSQIYGDPIDQPSTLGGYIQPWFNVDNVTKQLINAKFKLDVPAGADGGLSFVANFGGPTGWIASGDYRINKTPGLRVLGMIFMKEHNRLVDELSALHPTWSTLRLFHEARRKNIAFYQSITFREYLAGLAGAPLPPYEGYKADVNPGLDTVFAVAAFRYGHSGIPAFVPLLDNQLNYCPRGAIRAADIWLPKTWELPDEENPWFDPATGNTTTKLRSVMNYDAIIRGLTNSYANKIDMGFIDDLRNTQSQGGGPRHGNDLIATDIFRSRDTGLPDYNSLREYLGFPRFTHFENITSSKYISGALNQVYGSIDKIDAFVGLMAETHLEGAELGETAAKIIQDQFQRLRDGDRFFFENPDQFSPEEIEEVHSTKLKDLILRNFHDIDSNALPQSSFFLNVRQLTAFKPDRDFEDPILYAVCAKDRTEDCEEADRKIREGDKKRGIEGLKRHTKRQVAPSDTDVVEVKDDRDGYLPWATLSLSAAYQMSWAIDRHASPQEIHFLIQVETEGWAGIGFAPEAQGTMKGADIILCRVSDEVSECRDSKAFDVGVPILDTDRDGEDNIRDVLLKREDGVLTARFTRYLTATDVDFDNDIADNLRIIFAFHPTTNELRYHGPTRNPDVTLNFLSGYEGPPEQIPIDRGVTIFLYVICGIGSVLSLIYIVLVIVKAEYFKFQTPEFCILVCFGSLLGYISVLLILPDDQSTQTCEAHLWLFGMSFWLVFMGFFVKVARVYWIIWRSGKTLEVTVLPFWQLCIPIVLCILGEAGFNIAWDVAVTPDLDREDFLEDNEYILYCAADRGMWIGSVTFRACFLALGVVLAFLTRKMPTELNWSKEIAMAIYTMAIILGIGIPLGFALSGSATMVVMLKGLTTSIAYLTVTTIVHWDSLKRIIAGKDARERTKAGNTVSKAGQSSASTA